MLTAILERADQSIRDLAVQRELRALDRLCQDVTSGARAERFDDIRNGLGAGGDAGLVRYLSAAHAAASSALGMSPYGSQILGAAAMLRGFSIQLATGEGKTLVGALAGAGLALQGHGVHVLTANDYLAARDADWMRPFYEAMGLTCGVVLTSSSLAERQVAYSQDVTYSSVSEAGFDMLRDRLCMDASALTGARRDCVLLDEADAVLLDEARVPLVLAADGEAHHDEDAALAARLVGLMDARLHYSVAPDRRTVNFTDEGVGWLESRFPDRALFDGEDGLLTSLNLALYAHAVLEKDVDYVVDAGRVWLVSETRGRVERLQRWPDGLQLAVEVKEGLGSLAGLEVLDQLVVSELVEHYREVAGMSATLRQAEDELEHLYGIKVLPLAPHRECMRTDHDDQLYVTASDRDEALVRLVAEVHGQGRPVLVACQSVAESEDCAELLALNGLDCVLLNAKNDAQEAALIADAGQSGRITVSTQMAGRGTDILLSRDASAAGGLYVIGVGRFASARLDDQLRGRAGRQGDPGDSVFLTSLEDRQVQRAEPVYRRPKFVTATGQIIDRKVEKVVTHAQRVSEGEQYGLRRMSWNYSRLLRIQRGEILKLRTRCLSDGAALELLETSFPEDMATLHSAVERNHLKAGSRVAVLAMLDARWSAHLALASEIREGIHLRVLVREDPLVEFERAMVMAFRDPMTDALHKAVTLLHETLEAEGAIDAELLSTRVPTATWAYTVTDNSLGSELERLGRGLMGASRS